MQHCPSGSDAPWDVRLYSCLHTWAASWRNAQVLCYDVRNLKLVLKSASAEGNRLCFLQHLKLLEKSLPLHHLPATYVFQSSAVLSFQCRFVHSLRELDWELMKGKMKLLFLSEFSLTEGTYCISLIGWMFAVLPWPLGDTAQYWK